MTTPESLLFGIPVKGMTMDQALDKIHDTIVKQDHLQIGVVNAAKIVNMQRNSMLNDDVMSSGLLIDGTMANSFSSNSASIMLTAGMSYNS